MDGVIGSLPQCYLPLTWYPGAPGHGLWNIWPKLIVLSGQNFCPTLPTPFPVVLLHHLVLGFCLPISKMLFLLTPPPTWPSNLAMISIGKCFLHHPPAIPFYMDLLLLQYYSHATIILLPCTGWTCFRPRHLTLWVCIGVCSSLLLNTLVIETCTLSWLQSTGHVHIPSRHGIGHLWQIIYAKPFSAISHSCMDYSSRPE